MIPPQQLKDYYDLPSFLLLARFSKPAPCLLLPASALSAQSTLAMQQNFILDCQRFRQHYCFGQQICT
jgi:hypothetical protein